MTALVLVLATRFVTSFVIPGPTWSRLATKPPDLSKGESTTAAQLQPYPIDAPTFAEELVRNIFFRSTQGATNALLVGLAIAFVVFLVSLPLVVFPMIIEALEVSTKEKYPDLYEDYQSKLLHKESLIDRPDLIEELMDKVFYRMMEEIEQEASPMAFEDDAGESTSSSKPRPNQNDSS